MFAPPGGLPCAGSPVVGRPLAAAMLPPRDFPGALDRVVLPAESRWKLAEVKREREKSDFPHLWLVLTGDGVPKSLGGGSEGFKVACPSQVRGIEVAAHLEP